MANFPIINNLRVVPRDSEFLDRKLGSRGEIYFDRDTKTLRVYDGLTTGGIQLSKADLSNVSNSDFLAKATAAGVGSGGGGGGSTTVTVGTALPESPENGNLWLNTNNGVLYVYINDGDTLQWIQPSVPIPGLENYVTNDRLGNIDFNNNVITSGDSSAISFDVPIIFNSSATFDSITSGSIVISDNIISTEDSSLLTINVPTSIQNISISNDTITTVDSSEIVFTPLVRFSSDVVIENNLTINGSLNASIPASQIGLGNVTNESKTTMFTDSTFTGTTTANNLTINGITTIGQSVEKMTTKTGITSVTEFDFDQGTVWFLYDIGTNFTANFSNIPSSIESTISIALIINQSAVAYLPNAVQINGASQNLKWQGGSEPTPNAESTDIFSFTLIYTGSTWEVIGSLTTYA